MMEGLAAVGAEPTTVRYDRRHYHVPFGGRKGSSYGSREQGAYAKEFYITVKTAYTLA
jgi:acyl-CoA reductase-like NAD-dependent aldehyde dehydrogenase